jgi:hypothetical protein
MKQIHKYIVLASGILVLVIVGTATLTSQLVASQMEANRPVPSPSQKIEDSPTPVTTPSTESTPKDTPEATPKPEKTKEVPVKPPVQIEPFGGECKYAVVPHFDWHKSVQLADVYGAAVTEGSTQYFYNNIDGISQGNTDAFSNLDLVLLRKIKDNVSGFLNHLSNVDGGRIYNDKYYGLLRTANANEKELIVSCSRFIASEGIQVPN